MAKYRSSEWKTIAMAAAVALASATVLATLLALAWSRRGIWSPLVYLSFSAAILLAAVPTTWIALVTAGGMIALRRDSLEEQGRPYAHDTRRESVPGIAFVQSCSTLLRSLTFGKNAHARLGLRPGELIEVRSLEEIVETLDAHGTLGGIPFMPEMVAYCGSRVRVFRRVDKLHDWVHGTGLKRMRNLVLLENLRCDGLAHGGCQASCHLRWHEAWLRRVLPGTSPASPVNHPDPCAKLLADLSRNSVRHTDAAEGIRYVCQATELTAGGTPLSWTDPSHYARDVLTGNLRLRPFVVGVALACFNWFQRHRGGVVFPCYNVGTTNTSPHATLGLEAGELVRVKSKHLIETTLNNRSRNRGLYFDREMFRFCGGPYRVKTRAERVIVEKTGELRVVTNPCILLEGVTATGEYLGFNPENEYIFWREIWLERVDPVVSNGTATSIESHAKATTTPSAR